MIGGKTMEEFLKKVKRRILIFSGMLFVSVILSAYGLFEMDKSNEASLNAETVAEFQFGIVFGIGILALVQIIKLRSVINSDTKLKMLYYKEHDERLKTIRSKAGMPMLMITSIIMLIVASIGVYFNIIVFYTLVITAIIQLSIAALVKLYCSKTM